MRTVLHIGPHKTGTTSFQHRLHANRDGLAKAGILYPVSGSFIFGQHRLPFALLDRTDPHRGDVPDLSAEAAALKDEIERTKPDLLILSSEEFSVLRSDHIARLAETLDLETPEIVAVVRHPVELLFSAYIHRIIKPDSTFKQNVETFAANALSRVAGLDMDRWLAAWATRFGDSSVKLVPYRKGNIVADIVAEIGIDPGLLREDPAPLANAALDPRAVELVRLARLAGYSQEDCERAQNLAAGWFTDRAALPAITVETLRHLLETLCPLYDPVFEKYLGQANPFGIGNFEDLAARLSPGLNRKDLVSFLVETTRPLSSKK
ncbi:hypothetical protein AAD018_001505 [Aestuariibius insulae]|uniref:hypothetical protein n=1 Tax=Aestuariibius insulae TaxID=2058287 RepID=UPI00345E91C4